MGYSPRAMKGRRWMAAAPPRMGSRRQAYSPKISRIRRCGMRSHRSPWKFWYCVCDFEGLDEMMEITISRYFFLADLRLITIRRYFLEDLR